MIEKSVIQKAEVEAKCKAFIISQKKAVLTVCCDVNDLKNVKGWRQYLDIEFSANPSSFPRVQIIIPIEAYDFLSKTKRYYLAFNESPKHQAYMFSCAIIVGDSVPASLTNDKKMANVFITLENIRYENDKEGLGENVSFTTA